jgi:translation initiation factor 3 subunit J
MADNWDDGSDDEWDVDDDDLDARLGLKKVEGALPAFDDEEDLAVKEKAEADRVQHAELRTKGNALALKRAEEHARREEEELARKAVELEAAMEANLTAEERRELERKRIEEADNELTDDLFGGGDRTRQGTGGTSNAAGGATGDKVVMKDLKDHLKHARRVAECLRGHGKIHLASAFFKEALQQSGAVLDDDAVSELIKTLNVMKNEMVQAAKRKVKGQAQKSKKTDKKAEAVARKIQVETFGDNDKYDSYDAIGEDFEDAFF